LIDFAKVLYVEPILKNKNVNLPKLSKYSIILIGLIAIAYT